MRIPNAVRDLTRRLAEGLRTLPPSVILAIGWGLVLIYSYPGLMTMDSLDQLAEGRAGYYTDGHPAAMAAMWRYIDKLIAGPFGMLMVQTAAFLLGLYWTFKKVLSPRRAAVAASLVFLYPPVLAPMAVIWKDCIMAGFFALGIAGMLCDRRSTKIWGLVAFAVATSVRYNAFAATLPVIVLLFDVGLAPWWKRYAVAVGAWFAVTIVALGVSGALADKQMHVWHSSLAVFDIAGTLSEVDEDLPDDELRELLAGTGVMTDKNIQAAMRAGYVPYDYSPLIWGPHQLWTLPIQGKTPAPEAQRDAISRAFWETITSHPGAYLRHRWAAFREAVGLVDQNRGAVVMTTKLQYPGLLANAGIGMQWTGVQRWMQRRVQQLSHGTPLFTPWMYLLLSFLLIPLAWRQRDVLAILISGILMELTLFPLAPSPDYRYSHWLVVTTCVAVVMLTVRRAREVKGTAGG